MTDPLKGVLINGRYYNYEPDSFSFTRQLRNSSQAIQQNTTLHKSFNVNGLLPEVFTMTVVLDSSYEVYSGLVSQGPTTWLGASRKVDLESFMNARGNSMPIVFVPPFGTTYYVVPTGSLDYRVFNPTNPTSTGCEYRITLSLEAI